MVAQIYARWAPRAAIAATLLALGIGLEYVQDLVGRDFSYTDMPTTASASRSAWALAVTPLGKVLKKIDA